MDLCLYAGNLEHYYTIKLLAERQKSISFWYLCSNDNGSIIISVWMKIGNSSSIKRGLSLAIENFESVFSFLFISGCRDLCFIGKVG